MSLIALLTRRYIFASSSTPMIGTMTWICFISMFISSCALALVLSIMTGFEQETHRMLQGIHAPIIMQSDDHALAVDKITPILAQEFPAIRAVSPYVLKQIIIQKREGNDSSHALFLKGVDPALEEQVTTIGSKVIAPLHQPLSDIAQGNHIVIGNKLAEHLDVQVGDRVTVLFPEKGNAKRRVSLSEKEAIIGGIFKTGIEEFDDGLAYSSFDFLHILFPDEEISHIALALHPYCHAETIIPSLQDRFGLTVYSWKDLYPALVSALTLEKYAMLAVMFLIALVAAMNIISLMFMQITRKRADIAMLKAMGMEEYSIRRVFILFGMAIAAAGSFCGLCMAAIIGLFLQRFSFIELPDTYYVTHLPIVMEFSIFGTIFVAVLVVSFVASLIPLKTIKLIKSAHILRFEG